MAYENINFSKPHLIFVGGYFYMFDETGDRLVQKLDDGRVSFSYPLDNLLDSTIVSAEHDGVNFWTMEDGETNQMIVKRWQINNAICKLKQTITLASGTAEIPGNHYFDSEAFTIENYHTELANTISGGSTEIEVDSYYDTVITSGVILTLGPNSSNQYENVTVSSVSGTNVTLVSGTQYSYDIDDKVNFYTNLWLFNNYNGVSSLGALYKFDAHTGNYITKTGNSEYDNIKACTFSRTTASFVSAVDALIYVKSTNLKFINVNDLSVYGTMIMDNIRSDNITVIPVYDLAISNHTVFRLQDEATYYGVDYDWGSMYNYQISTMRQFVDSITVAAYPVILPANGINVAEITATVLDQFGNGVRYKPVLFTDDDDVGFMTINPAYTDYFWGTGKAISYYKAGVTVHTVNIEGTATQYD